MRRIRAILIWAALLIAVAVPLAAASASPLLAWREPLYIVAGFAGIVAMTLLLIQPLLAAGVLPGLAERRGRRIHRWTGGAIVLAIVAHVAGLWITSPPDMLDALLFRSPTPFSAWGVLAMWAVFATALLAGVRRRLHLRWRTWRRAHVGLALLIVSGTVVHALLIEGTMQTASKVALSALVFGATLNALVGLRAEPKRTPSS